MRSFILTCMLAIPFLSCRKSNGKVVRVIEKVVEKKVTKEEAQRDWEHFLRSKGITNSLCVQGLIARLESWDCSHIEVNKYEDRVVVKCLPNNDERITYWERYAFEIRQSVLMNNNVNGININRHPSICVDTIQKVTAHKIENPLREHLKIKNK